MKKIMLSALTMVGLTNMQTKPIEPAKPENLENILKTNRTANILKTAGLASATIALGVATAYGAYKTKTNLQIKGLSGSGQLDLLSPTIAACAGIPTTALCAVLTGAFGFSLYGHLKAHDYINSAKDFLGGIHGNIKARFFTR